MFELGCCLKGVSFLSALGNSWEGIFRDRVVLWWIGLVPYVLYHCPLLAGTSLLLLLTQGIFLLALLGCHDAFFFPPPPLFFYELKPKVMISFSEFVGFIGKRVCMCVYKYTHKHTWLYSNSRSGCYTFCSVATLGEAGPPCCIRKGVGKELESCCMGWCNPELQSRVLCSPQ